MSTLQVTNLKNASTADGGISIDTSGHVTVDGVAMPSSGPLSNRNKIINGDMRIDQRNAGASITINGGFPVDRWGNYYTGGGAITSQRSTTAPSGFTNSLQLTASTVDSSLAAGDYYFLRQNIEGFNSADLGYGTADAKTITLSFWVRSSVTGTYGGSLGNSAETRSYAFTFTVNAANTWEYKTISIPGDTTGTWVTNNGVGLRVNFSLGMGSNFLGAAGSWTGSLLLSATGATNWISTSGATFYITGVQLEVGTVATPFEHRSYGQELALCQRYFEKNTRSSNTETSTAVAAVFANPAGSAATTNDLFFKVEKRVSPTITILNPYNSATVNQVRQTWGTTNHTVVGSKQSQTSFSIDTNSALTATVLFHYDASAEL